MHRRKFLQSAASTFAGVWALSGFDPAARGADSIPSRKQGFDYAWLKGKARTMAQKPFEAPPRSLPESLAALDWDRYQAIGYRAENALWAKRLSNFRLEFFHRGLTFVEPVRMYEVVNGLSEE